MSRHSWIALCVLGGILLFTNSRFTQVDDESAIIDIAAKPALETIKIFLDGGKQHEHPPLYDLVLHEWLTLTAGSPHLLRLPSIVFYVIGAWLLVLAATHMAGDLARIPTVLLLLVWPYGFHFGRLATWYSFAFLLLSWLTLNYVKYLENPSLNTWVPVALCSLALIYTNYFAWAILACLGLDLLLRFGRTPEKLVTISVTAVTLVLAAVPILPAFIKEVRTGAKPQLALSAIASGIYSLYCLFISESVAPWFWIFGITGGLAISCALFSGFLSSPLDARRFLLYFGFLLAVMTVLQIGNTKRMMSIAPWLILPMGIALTSVRPSSSRVWLVASLSVAGAIGWYGILSRDMYAAPHWVEPWEKVAQNAAAIVSDGGVVISNSSAFFFYMTYLSPSTNPVTTGHFRGLLPTSVRAPRIFTPQQWIDAGQPVGRSIVLINGLAYQAQGASIESVRPALDARCKAIKEEQQVRDAGVKWKQRFSPETGQRAWRIQISTYAGCARAVTPL